MKRLDEIFSHITPCGVFADIGCDHGLLTQKMIESGKCENAVITDISAPSLKKAENLLKKYVDEGKVKSIVCDGFDKIGKCDGAAICGMGGEETVSIIKNASFLPQKLYLQPMKNSDKVRRILIEKGYSIITDYTFKDGKFYDYIIGDLFSEKREYSQDELIWGKDNLNNLPSAFKEKLRNERNTLNLAKKSASFQTEITLQCKINKITEILDDESGNAT